MHLHSVFLSVSHEQPKACWISPAAVICISGVCQGTGVVALHSCTLTGVMQLLR